MIKETSKASIYEIKFQNYFFKLRNSQKNGKFDQKRIFYFLLYSLEIFQTSTMIISEKFQEYFVTSKFVQNDYSQSYSCLKLTYALNLSHSIKIMTVEIISLTSSLNRAVTLICQKEREPRRYEEKDIGLKQRTMPQKLFHYFQQRL